MRLPDKVYDVLKWVGLIALPAIGLAYGQLATIWGLPYGTQIPTTCDIFGVLIGTLIGVSAIAINNEKKVETDDDTNGED